MALHPIYRDISLLALAGLAFSSLSLADAPTPVCSGRVDENATAQLLATKLPPGTHVGNPIFLRVIKRPQPLFDMNPSIADTVNPHGFLDTTLYRAQPTKYLDNADFSALDSGSTKLRPHKPDGTPDRHMNRYSTYVATVEVWIQSDSGKFVLFKPVPVSVYSGTIGPKVHHDDAQTPEGFYKITEAALNPKSEYRASMDLGFPNAYDRATAKPGTNLGGSVEMHGCWQSAGCLAMGKWIDEIYTLAHAALKSHSQEEIPIHIFPFPLTDANLAKIPEGSLKTFWKGLQPGYQAFQNGMLPTVTTENGKYVVSGTFPGNPNNCVNLDSLQPTTCPMSH